MPKKFVRDARRAAAASRSTEAPDTSSAAKSSVSQESGNELTSQVEIGPGTSFEVPIICYEGCVLVWSFNTLGGDIGFGVAFKGELPNPAAYGPPTDADDDTASSSNNKPVPFSATEEVSLLDSKRYDSDAKESRGTLKVGRSGTVTLRWDNSYSFFKAKSLLYSIELEEPLGGLGGPRPVLANDVPKVVFVLGGPGAGKGTQCARLAKEFGFLHVSAGDLLRDERNDPNSQHGALITEHIKEGKIVPVAITVALLWRAIRNSARRFVLVDGFPRNQDNLDGWNRKVGARAEVACALNFECPDDVLVPRLLERGKSSGREDDNEISIRKRLSTFHQETMPIVNHFSETGILVRVNGNRDKEVVFEDLKKILLEKLRVPSLPAVDDYYYAAPRSKAAPKLVLGTMTMGGDTGMPAEAAQILFNDFCASQRSEANIQIDTARMYGKGDTERVIGQCYAKADAQLKPKVKIHTKVNPFPGYGNSLAPTSIATQLNESLTALKVDSVDVLFLHAPDPFTPIEDTLEACDSLHRNGKFRELGISNFPAWLVVHAVHICKARGFVRPTVYQGMLNALTRDVERELIPALRACDLRFECYNPLAGGLLTSGRYLENAEEVPETGRFGSETPGSSMYRDRYWKATYFAALAEIDEVCRGFNIKVQDAALRWLSHHSALRATRGDAIVLGGSSRSHLQENIKAVQTGGPLPVPVVVAFEQAWLVCKSDCPKYFRP